MQIVQRSKKNYFFYFFQVLPYKIDYLKLFQFSLYLLYIWYHYKIYNNSKKYKDVIITIATSSFELVWNLPIIRVDRSGIVLCRTSQSSWVLVDWNLAVSLNLFRGWKANEKDCSKRSSSIKARRRKAILWGMVENEIGFVGFLKRIFFLIGSLQRLQLQLPRTYDISISCKNLF